MSELAIRHGVTDNAPTEYTPGVLDLLSAIQEALSVPLAATNEDDRRRARVLDHRVIDVDTIIHTVIQFGALFSPAEQAAKLREWTERSPVDFAVYQRAEEPA